MVDEVTATADGASEGVDVSVIIPVYNRQAVLIEALDSLFWERSLEPADKVRGDGADRREIARTDDDDRRQVTVEAIIVDDGSDEPLVLPPPFSNMTNIKLIRQENGGASSARNTGLEVARGEFVAYLDSDDLFAADKLDRIVPLFEENPSAGFLFTDLRRFQRPSRRSDAAAEPPPGELKPRLNFMPQTNSDFYPSMRALCNDLNLVAEKSHLLDGRKLFQTLAARYPVFPSTLVLRSSLAKEIGKWEVGRRLSEDFNYLLRLCREANGIYIDEPLAYLGRGDDNVSDSVLNSALADIEVLEAMEGSRRVSTSMANDRRRVEVLPSALQFRYMRLGYGYCEEGRFHEAAAAYRKALRFGLRSKESGAMKRNVTIVLNLLHSQLRSWLD